jgi:hypothetical protein
VALRLGAPPLVVLRYQIGPAALAPTVELSPDVL